jgi:hypothetical protein
MSETNYLRGHCDHCREAIEFPAESTGQSTACPLCARTTQLHASVTESSPAASGPAKPGKTRATKRNPFIVVGISVVLLIDFLGAWFWFFRSNEQPAASGTPPPHDCQVNERTRQLRH